MHIKIGFAQCWLVAITAGLLTGFSTEAADHQPVSADGCVVELTLPKNTTVTVDRRDEGTKRTFTFRPLKPGSWTAKKFLVKFPGGKTEERQVWLAPGRNLKLALSPPNPNHPELVPQTGHNNPPNYSVVSKDGHFLLTATGPQAILWDVATGRQLRTFAGHAEELKGVGFALEDKRVMTASFDGKIAIWDRDSGRGMLSVDVGTCYAAAMSPDGSKVAVGGVNEEFFVLDAVTGQKIRTFTGVHKGYVDYVAFSPDGRRLLTGSDDKTAAICDVETGQVVSSLNLGDYVAAGSAFSRDGRRLVTMTRKWNQGIWESSELVLWNTESGERLANFHLTSPMLILSCAFSPDDKYVASVMSVHDDASGNDPSKVQVLDAASLTPVRMISEKDSWASCVAFTPDGKSIFDGIHLFDFETGTVVRKFAGRLPFVSAIDLTIKDGIIVLVAHSDAIQFVNLSTSQVVGRFPRASEDEWFGEACFISGGQRILAAVNSEKTSYLVVYDAENGAELQRFPVTSDTVCDLQATPDGQFAFFQTLSGSAALWNVSTEKLLHTFGGGKHLVQETGISNDGTRVAISDNKPVDIKTSFFSTIVDAPSGRELHTLQLSTESRSTPTYPTSYYDHAVAFSPDGNSVLTGGEELLWNQSTQSLSNDGFIMIWDADSGKLLKQFRTKVTVKDVGYSTRGDFLLAKCEDSTATVWHLPTQQQLCTVPHFGFRVLPKITPNGRFMVTMEGDCSLVLWDIATGQQLCHYYLLTKGEDWLAITPEGLFDGTETARQQVMFRVGGGLSLVPVDRFFNDFYRPGLIAELVSNDRPLPDVQLAKSAPPKLRITSPQSGKMDHQELTIAAEAVDQGGGVSGLALYQNGARILADGETRQNGKTTYRTFKIALVEGDNHFRITAANLDGSWESEPAKIVLRFERPLDKSHLHVVAVGINKYADANLNLRYAAPDAAALSELFRNRGGKLYEEVHVTQLSDEEATKPAIKEALRKAAASTLPQDTLVLFLAGHGAMVGQRYYFVPHEMRRQTDTIEDDLRSQGLPADELSEHLGEARALKRVMILDTCSSGGALAMTMKGRSGFALRGAIERLARTQGVFTIAAASATEEAQESSELGHGVLSYALLAGLRGVNGGPLDGKYVHPGSPDRVVDIMEWFTFAAGQVPRLTEMYYGAAQDVQTSTQGQSFPLLPLDN